MRARRCPIRAVPSCDELGARGGGTSLFGGVFGCQCDGFHVLLPQQVTEPEAAQHQCCSLRRELGEPVRAEPFYRAQAARAYGGAVCLCTHMPIEV